MRVIVCSLLSAAALAAYREATKGELIGSWVEQGIDCTAVATFKPDQTVEYEGTGFGDMRSSTRARWKLAGDQLLEWVEGGQVQKTTIVNITPTRATVRYAGVTFDSAWTRNDPAEWTRLIALSGLLGAVAGAIPRRISWLIAGVIMSQLLLAPLIYCGGPLLLGSEWGEYQAWQLRVLGMIGFRTFLWSLSGALATFFFRRELKHLTWRWSRPRAAVLSSFS